MGPEALEDLGPLLHFRNGLLQGERVKRLFPPPRTA